MQLSRWIQRNDWMVLVRTKFWVTILLVLSSKRDFPMYVVSGTTFFLPVQKSFSALTQVPPKSVGQVDEVL